MGSALLSFDWYVVGRTTGEDDVRKILVEDQLSGRLGVVLTFTEEQWDRAETASRHAYRWNLKWGEVTELTATVA